jgi:spore coat protein H
MKKRALYIFLLHCLAAPLFSQSTSLFDDTRVSAIYIQLPADSLDKMIGELVNDYYLPAQFVFDDGLVRDTVNNIGLRLRGNTSLLAQKKSFKISFNEFESGRKYQGVRKLNLRGSHNDPTMIREKLFYDVWAKAGMPVRRVAFVKLYLNGIYRGLYSNAEEIDKEWLDDVYGDNDGNLYKCTWPADLVYKGPGQQPYKAILNNPETRAYDLTTNETEDDYTRLVELITALNQPVDAAFAGNIEQILNVSSVLKAFAIDVATGNWDDYFYNKNNYYLYDNPATGRFEFFTFDTDNTFGIDWLGVDWTKRHCLAWQHSSEPRPLAAKLLAVPAFQDQYIRYLDTITRFIVHPDSIFSRINLLHQLIIPAAAEDTYRTLDYGYTMTDFHQGFTQTVDGHSPYGIKPFLEIRHDSTMAQIGRILSSSNTPGAPALSFSIYPNPASGWLFIQAGAEVFSEITDGEVCDMTGRILARWEWEVTEAPIQLDVKDFPQGFYRLRLRCKGKEGIGVFLKR